ncbi:hypothetical protein MCUN1_001367 [Malassezia cuniculi]|uniref:Uncharacterized protein n=1 Tax=Malassezia cuniculi TaxID=948313 RepID=A0AAF0EUD6_9BASI|nr:hypothetical protein MCUN1_001367 [Malassezia cuniculi]
MDCTDQNLMSIPYQDILESNYEVPLFRAPRAKIKLGVGDVITVSFNHGSGAYFMEKLRIALDNYRKYGTPLRESN